MLIKFLVVYAAGSLGALVSALALFAVAQAGWMPLAQTALDPSLGIDVLYAKLVWGGLWAFIGLIPPLAGIAWWRRALLVPLFPAAAQLLYFYPRAGEGWFGLNHGPGTAGVVLLIQVLWGWVTFGAASRADV